MKNLLLTAIGLLLAFHLLAQGSTSAMSKDKRADLIGNIHLNKRDHNPRKKDNIHKKVDRHQKKKMLNKSGKHAIKHQKAGMKKFHPKRKADIKRRINR